MVLSLVCIFSIFFTLFNIYASNNNEERKIVVFKNHVKDIQKDNLLKKHGAQKFKKLDSINGVVVIINNNSNLINEDEVLYIEDDYLVSIDKKDKENRKPTPEPDPQTTQVIPWGIEYMDAPSMWSDSTDYLKVAIIDTGIDLDHPDLKDNIKGGFNALRKNKSPEDDNGHGTHVAGIIGACNNDIGVVGMIPNADLYAIKALDSNGNGYVSDIIEGIDWSIKNDIDIINMSLGMTNNSVALHDIIIRAYNLGIIMVAAAGNNYGENIEYPAAYEEVIGIGATDKDGNIAEFSAEVGVYSWAPGVEIYSTAIGGGYVKMSGTSMATPHWIGLV